MIGRFSLRPGFFAAFHAAGLGLAGSLAAVAPAAGQAIGIDHQGEYADCMALAGTRPADAFEGALAWQAQDGGEAARHCAAVALIGLGDYDEAARRLEDLGQKMTGAPASLRAEVLGQAGQAWLMAGNPRRALAAQSAAIELDPENVELLIDRSIALAGTANYWEAVDDLNKALDLAPGRAELLILRASAYRYLDARELALEDVERALTLAPDNPDGLLERGILRRLAGDALRARDDWLKIIEIADGTPAAEAARANLKMLDAKAE